ncbi:MAG: hypothetical protein JNK82_38310 [Myxococcaceae bacterium]|nr:hypothetical protein [Myxococcaceae bacterium]
MFDGAYDEVYDAAYLALEKNEGRILAGSRLEGIIEGDKIEFTAPPGWDGTAYRSYSISVYPEGARVGVTAVPRLWADERDVSDEPRWVLPGYGGEEEHWEKLFEHITDLLHAWRTVPELTVDASRGEVKVMGVRFNAPPDWRGLEVSVDRRTAISQSSQRGKPGCAECPGGMNPTIVFEVARRSPPADAHRLENVALENALGPKLVAPEAWDATETVVGLRGTGLVVAGDPGKTVPVVWWRWDAKNPTWMIRAAAACGPPESPAGCDAQWQAVIDGVVVDPR